MPVSPEEHEAAIEASAHGPEAAQLDQLVEKKRAEAATNSQSMFAVQIPKDTPPAAVQFVKSDWEAVGWVVKYDGSWRLGEGAFLRFSKPPKHDS